jgi:hypothetical protein
MGSIKPPRIEMLLPARQAAHRVNVQEIRPPGGHVSRSADMVPGRVPAAAPWPAGVNTGPAGVNTGPAGVNTGLTGWPV